jgi:hypothetical protein
VYNYLTCISTNIENHPTSKFLAVLRPSVLLTLSGASCNCTEGLEDGDPSGISAVTRRAAEGTIKKNSKAKPSIAKFM